MPPDASLYRPPLATSKPSKTPFSASLSGAFNSTLSSLISSAHTSSEPKLRPPRPSQSTKDDIFTSHKRGSLKRSAADVTDGINHHQKHSTASENLDEAAYKRSKRKMEEKARLYASMKRGDYVPRQGGRDKEAEGLVDFDAKWADEHDDAEEKDRSSDDYASSDEDEDTAGLRVLSARGPTAPAELVEIEDEFGRVRRVSRKEADKLQRQRAAAVYATTELESFSARPSRPDNIITGDAIQHSAYNPDEPIAVQMSRLAEKRDRSLTPPEEEHYDATKEIRSKGVGFYQFSKDNEERARQMGDLEKERGETERLKKEREERREKKKQEMQKRRDEEAQARAKRDNTRRADSFLDALGGELNFTKGSDDA